MKQKLDEDLKSVKQAKEQVLQEAQTKYEAVRRKHFEMNQKKESINFQLQNAMKVLEER